MNRFPFSALVATTALAMTAFAQTPSPAEPANPPAPPRPDAPLAPINPQQATPVAAPPETTAPAAPLRELVFAEADADKDSRVSLTEYANFVESRHASRSVGALNEQTIERFRQLDQDNDAFLSESEATVQQQPPAQTSPGVPPRTRN
jgi:hypothetical protein